MPVKLFSYRLSASDSALMLTVCALQMFVLLLLLSDRITIGSDQVNRSDRLGSICRNFIARYYVLLHSQNYCFDTVGWITGSEIKKITLESLEDLWGPSLTWSNL